MLYTARLPKSFLSRLPIVLGAVLLSLSATSTAAGDPPTLLPEPAVAALAAELSGTNARHIVQELSLHHRMRGSHGFRKAAEAIRDRARSYGLDDVEMLELPADGDIFYGTQRSRPAWDVDFAELWEQQQQEDGEWRDARLVASWANRPVTLAQDSAPGAVTAELVDVGAGTSKSDYEGLEIRGKLVLTSSQPGAAASLAVDGHGAAGLISYAQNQKSAWWGEDRNLVRWGHLETFPPPETFAFMVTVNQAESWRQRLARGESVRLRARVETRRHAGVYAIPMATIRGQGDLASQEIVFSCHLDHQRPGANDNASGCATILEAARVIAKLVRAGKIAPPRRTLRFVWPPEIEGTLALLTTRPDLAARARAVIHLDMVGGTADVTRSISHLTRSPASLPSVANDVAEAFGRFINDESYAYAATGAADYPLVDAEGSRQAWQARFADFSLGSDHEVWSEGSFRVPAIYLNDWPDRYIHTHADHVANLDPTKLLRAAFVAAASGYALARPGPEEVSAVLATSRRHALHRTAAALARSAELDNTDEALNLLSHHLDSERLIAASVDRFAAPPPAERTRSQEFLAHLQQLVDGHRPGQPPTPQGSPATKHVCRRHGELAGPLWAFGYSYLEDQLAQRHLDPPRLLSYTGRWGSGREYAHEIYNLIDGRRSAAELRDAVAAVYGPLPRELVDDFLDVLERSEIIACGDAVAAGR